MRRELQHLPRSDVGVSEIRVPYWVPDYEGILLFGGLYEGSPIFVNSHLLLSSEKARESNSLNGLLFSSVQ